MRRERRVPTLHLSTIDEWSALLERRPVKPQQKQDHKRKTTTPQERQGDEEKRVKRKLNEEEGSRQRKE